MILKSSKGKGKKYKIFIYSIDIYWLHTICQVFYILEKCIINHTSPCLYKAYILDGKLTINKYIYFESFKCYKDNKKLGATKRLGSQWGVYLR